MTRFSRMRVCVALLIFGMLVCVCEEAQATEVLWIATIAPEGSAWMRYFHQWAQTVRTRSHGELELRFYPGGIQGDEGEVVRRMQGRLAPLRANQQIDGAALTAAGLGQIEPAVLAFQIPRLFRDARAVEHAFLSPDVQGVFVRLFRENSARGEGAFEVLGWAHVGTMYAFADHPIRTRDDIRTSRFWIWNIDPVAEMLLQAIGTRGFERLPIADVQPALRSGRINAVLTTPLGAVALGWGPWMRYMTEVPITQIVGAIVIRRDRFLRLSLTLQEMLQETMREMAPCLAVELRRQDRAAVLALRARGMGVVSAASADVTTWNLAFEQARRMLIGRPASAVVNCELISVFVRQFPLNLSDRLAWTQECNRAPSDGTSRSLPLLEVPASREPNCSDSPFVPH